MAKVWRVRAHDFDRITRLERQARVTPLVAQLLVARGVEDPQRAADFLDSKLTQLHDPGLLPGVQLAAERLWQAISERERIVVYGDYDVDGMTAASLLVQCVQLLGGDVRYHVPNRFEEGYGLNSDALRTLASQGARLVVTVDCGIGSVGEARVAREIGLDLIITDHHELGASVPDAVAVVHPRLPGGGYPFGYLSGAGVAFKLAWAICQQASGAQRVGERLRNFLLEAVGLAMIGTVADCVPLIDENRVIVRYGLQACKERASLGLKALMRVTELDRKTTLDADDIGFTIAPRLNAVGRLGQALLGIELLTTTAADRAFALAEYINELNGQRQGLERSIYLTAHKQITERFDPDNDAALVLADHDWHAGVIGIVAGRIAEKFHKPTILISFDKLGVKPGVGSARSVPGFDLHTALAVTSQFLLTHGGHAAAAGLKIEESQLEAFRAAFCEYAQAELTPRQRVAELWIDAEVPLHLLTTTAIDQVEQLAPFGQGNPRPLFCATGVTLTEPPKRIGGGGRHLALRIRQGETILRAVAFGGGDWCEDLQQHGGPLDIVFRPMINAFRGRRTVELQLTDWRVPEPIAVG